MFQNRSNTATKNGNDNDGIVGATALAIPTYGGTTTTETVIFDNDETAALVTAYNKTDVEAAGPVFRDVPFAILFLLHLAVMIYLGVFVAPAGIEKIQFNFTSIEEKIREKESNDLTDEDFEKMEQFAQEASEYLQVYPTRIVLYFVIPCLLLSFVVAFITTAAVIKPCPKPIVYASLVGSIAGTAMVMVSAAIASNEVTMYAVTAVSLGVVGYYVYLAWRMVPFAAVNLKVALEGIGRNWGMYIVAFLFAELGFIWNIFWVYVVIGLSAESYNESCMAEQAEADTTSSLSDTEDCGAPAIVFLALLLSLYWTSTVIMNTIQVTVSGVMATWCFVSEEADQCCSPAVSSSLIRSMTYSFGSICFGSLLQALISVLRYALEKARDQRENGGRDGCATFLLCILECIAKCLEDVLEYFNQWAYVFVGIYGLSYLESGRKVVELFRARGWTSIVTDNLVGFTLGFVIFAVGVGTGLLGMLLERSVDKIHVDPSGSYIFGPLPGPHWFAFGSAFLVGVWVTSVMMNVVKGAVNALIVCWADSPAKLEYQHSALTTEMAEAWTNVFPESRAHFQPSYPARVV